MNKLNINGNNISYVDTGSGPVLVLVHGTPSSSHEYSELIDILKTKYRCIAIDHLGFGHSDKPANGDYSLNAHTNRLKKLLEHLGINSYHLLVHDFGGVISLPIAIENWENIMSLTLLNTWFWPIIETEPNMKSQLFLLKSPVMKFLYLKFNFSAKVLLKMAWGKHQPLSKKKHLQYQSYFKNSTERMGTYHFLKALIDFENPAWQSFHKLKELSKKEINIIWGNADSLVSTRNLDRWKEIFPDASIKALDKVGHFVADEAASEVANTLMSIREHK